MVFVFMIGERKLPDQPGVIYLSHLDYTQVTSVQLNYLYATYVINGVYLR